MSTVVVVPLSNPLDDWRLRAWRYVHDRLVGDGWPILTGVRDEPPWIKADAVADALRCGIQPNDVLVIMDADVVVNLTALRSAVARVESGDVSWAMPHTLVHRLTADMTELVYADLALTRPERPELVRWPYVGIPGGGCTVLKRATYDDVPLDRRFTGWGDEDQSWGWALGTLRGEPWRAAADLWHLWHPPAAGHQQRNSSSLASNKLRRAYRAYRTDPARMRALVADAR